MRNQAWLAGRLPTPAGRLPTLVGRLPTLVGRLLTLAGLPLTLAGCGTTDPSTGKLVELELAARAWDRADLASYVYSVERLCFCAPDGRGPVRVRVEDGVVTERTYVDSGNAVPDGLREAFPAVEGLFDILRDAIESGAHSVTVTYHPDLGVPVEFFIDYHEQMADEELGMRVTEDVEPLP